MAEYGTYRHRSLYPKAWLWWLALMLIVLGIVIYFGLNKENMDPGAIRVQRLSLFVCLGASGICAVAATASRWFYR